jgi:muconate cycloisomerase
MGNNWSKSLIDNALHDAAAKTLNRPITEIIGGTVRTSFPISAGIGTESPEAMAKSALEYVQKGFKTIKLKIGEVDNIQLDIDRVKEVRAAVGDNILIRVDANGVYSVPQAIKVINKMEKYDLDHVEQPVADRNFEGMAQIRSKICTPLMADESVHTLKDAYDIIKLGAADVIKLKMVKNGGYRRCQEIAALCHSEGIEVVLGNGYNSSAAAIAELSLACSSNHISPAGEFCGPDKLTSDILLNPMVVENGNAILPKGAGIGSDIDYEVFNKSILDPKYLIK